MWRCLSSLTTLRELHTDNLRLADVPGEVLRLTCLTSLHHKSGLETLSRDLSPLPNLMELDISGSNFDCIPIMTSQSLRTLTMDACDPSFLVTRECVSRLKALPHLQKVTFGDLDQPPHCLGWIVDMARELPLVVFEFRG